MIAIGIFFQIVQPWQRTGTDAIKSTHSPTQGKVTPPLHCF